MGRSPLQNFWSIGKWRGNTTWEPENEWVKEQSLYLDTKEDF